ncbi:MAG: hypothetical protein OXF73_03390 [Gammaproteobacteria bacterium]|nr:hypothetical protein [Gammaproteobacteria bacterium]
MNRLFLREIQPAISHQDVRFMKHYPVSYPGLIALEGKTRIMHSQPVRNLSAYAE